MADYLIERDLRHLVSKLSWDTVERAEAIRLAEPAWSALRLETVKIATSDASYETDDLADARAWLSRRADDGAMQEIFVRWTPDGRPAAANMRRIALRLGGYSSTLWVGDTANETGVEGMAERLVGVIRSRADRLMETTSQSGDPLPQGGGSPPRLKNLPQHPIVVAVGGGLIVAWVVQRLGWA